MSAPRNIAIDLTNLPRAMNAAFRPLYLDTHRYLVLVGGAGSGKSVWAAQKLLTRLVSERGHKFAILRKVARTLRLSVFQLFRDLIAQWQWTEFFRVNKSDMTITFTPTGATLIFLGLDDAEKLKSIAGITGIWIEEATELTELDFEQVDLRLRGKTSTYKQIILTFNPISHLHWLKARFFDSQQHEMSRTLRTTYKHNRFLDAEYARKIELLAEQNPSLYRVYGQGEWGVLEGLVYNPPAMLAAWPQTGESGEMLPVACDVYGMDFGYNNPTTLVGCALHDVNRNTMQGDVYLQEVLYESNLDTPEIIARMNAARIPKATPIFADAAEPDRIKTIGKAGYNIHPAHKGAGSVAAGINTCRSLTLHSIPDNTNLNAEFGSYVWATTRDGQRAEKPIEFNDHAMDAMRYALWSHLRVPPPEVFDRSLIGF